MDRTIFSFNMLNVAVLGDSRVGKACFLFAYALEANPWTVPDVMKTFSSDVTVGNESMQVTISSSNDVNSVHNLPTADVFIICFGLDDPQSLANVQSQWIPAVRATFGHIPILVVGMKSDLRDIYKKHKKIYLYFMHRKPINEKAGKKVAKKFCDVKYTECSVIKVKDVMNVMTKATRMSLPAKNSATSSLCSIM
uniref:Ras-like GTP-binding protein Rho1 n=1 Tax=Steinernema glaseri TaxID=37863 RepID=A0A1I7Z661_9BILA